MAEDMERAKAIIREAYEAFNRGDFDAASEHLHPDVEWNRLLEVESAPITGRDAVKANMEPDVWSEQNVEITWMDTVGDAVVLETIFRAKGSGSGIELENSTCHVWEIRDGKGYRFEAFNSREEAIAAAHASD